MDTIRDQATKRSFGMYFVHLFAVNADRFQLLAQKPACGRDCEYLNRPYELGDLMRQPALPVYGRSIITCPSSARG